MEKVIFDFDASIQDELNRLEWWVKNNQDKADTHQPCMVRMMEGEIHFTKKDIFLFRLKDDILPKWPNNNMALIMSDVRLEQNIEKWFGNKDTLIPVSHPLALLKRTISYINNKSITQPKAHNSIQRKYICLNAAAKKHRADLLTDIFAKGYQADGFYSWLNRYGTMKQKQFERPEIFAGMTANLDFDAKQIEEGNTQELLPPQYWYAGFDIVQESIVSDTSMFITEKTWKPILFSKIFIPHGTKGMIGWLKQHGFEPYDELYDSSFDNLPYEKRYKALLVEIEKLIKMTVGDWKDVYNDKEIKQKLAHNQNHFRNMAIPNWQRILDDKQRIKQRDTSQV
tara:strand:- start:443 stop:1462 length:1020 start_codon:yes stop_codon:yes gene_type:complete